MSEFFQYNRRISEKYRSELQKTVSGLIQPEHLIENDPPSPQQFYLKFKNQIANFVKQEIGKIQDEIHQSDNFYLLLLKQTALGDTVVQASFQTALWFYNHTKNQTLKDNEVLVAIVACGGYGREEMYFLSDVDIQIVTHPATDEGQAETFREIVQHFEYLFTFQDLLPARSSSRHSETVLQDKEMAPENPEEFVTLMEHRLVTGNPVVYAEFASAIKTASLLHKESIINQCARFKTYYEVQNTVFQQEPNVKEEFRRLYWALFLVRVNQGIEKTNLFELLYELFEKKIISAPAFKNMQSALNFLSKVRFFLHCHQKGSYKDVLSYEVRDKISQAMGYDLKTFYDHYYHQAAYPLKRYSRNLFWESTTQDTKRVKSLSGGFALNAENQIIFDKDGEEYLADNSHSLFRVFVLVAEKNYFISYPVTRAMEHHLNQMGPIFMNGEAREEVKSYFGKIIKGKYFAKAIRLLREFEILGSYFIPEFKNVYGLLQDIYVHMFPTDMHVLSALDALNQLETGKEVDAFLADLYHSLTDKTTLKLAVLLHDIGKGFKKGDQNEELLGSKMVPGILQNIGFANKPRRVMDVAFLVEKHLMMRDLMFLDPEADDTYDMVWDLVDHNIERLKMLVLLTYADRGGTKMKMTSAQINELKLFTQYTLHHKKRENVPISVKQNFLKMYRLPRDIQAQLAIYNEFVQSREQFTAELSYKPDQPSNLVVCTTDQRGLLFNIATVLAFNQLDILEANIQTFRNEVFDVFKVTNASGTPIEFSNFFFIQNQIKEDLKRIFIDKEPLASVYKGKNLVASPEKNQYQGIKLKIKIIGRAVKLETRDMFGTIMMEARVFSRFNMEIQKAVVHSNDGTASNIFYVRPEDVQYIINNEQHFTMALDKALNQLIAPGSMLLEEEPVEVT